MRYAIARFLSPTVDIIEHSTVVAIGVEYVSAHWTAPLVILAMVSYIIIHVVAVRTR